jgi:decaprenylphospho-beta-D-erythro-pentofuranosid-2-ulose 2-reductase
VADSHNSKKTSVAILGASSAIARGVAMAFAADGRNILLAARDVEDAAHLATDLTVRYGVETLALELRADQFDSHGAFVQQCIEAFEGTLDGVVLCFGHMETQAHAQSDFGATQRTIDLNLTAAVSLLEPFAAHFETRGKGFIAGISSVAGDRGRQSNYIYGASKAGFTTYLQGLRNRLFKSRVRVVTIKPGFVDTKMTFGLPGLFLVASPEAAGKAIVKAIMAGKDTAYVPWFWRYIMLIIRSVPEWQFKKMKL